jgi:hypothetical protein
MAAGRAGIQQHLGACVQQLGALDRPGATEVALQIAVPGTAEAGRRDARRGLDEVEAIVDAQGAFDLQDNFGRPRFHAALRFVAFDRRGGLLHVLDVFRLGQQDRVEAGTHHRIQVVGEKPGGRGVHAHEDRRAGVGFGRSATDDFGNQCAGLGLGRDRHRILKVENDRIGAALQRFDHHPLLDSGSK